MKMLARDCIACLLLQPVVMRANKYKNDDGHSLQTSTGIPGNPSIPGNLNYQTIKKPLKTHKLARDCIACHQHFALFFKQSNMHTFSEYDFNFFKMCLIAMIPNTTNIGISLLRVSL